MLISGGLIVVAQRGLRAAAGLLVQVDQTEPIPSSLLMATTFQSPPNVTSCLHGCGADTLPARVNPAIICPPAKSDSLPFSAVSSGLNFNNEMITALFY